MASIYQNATVRNMHTIHPISRERSLDDRTFSQRMPRSSNLFARPAVSRKRSNSVPVFGHVHVSAEEASVLVSAGERATERRRRRPASVDSPGPSIPNNYDETSLPDKPFNFSTPSRFGIGPTPLRSTVRNTASSVQHIPIKSQSPSHSDDDEDITPTGPDVKPLPPLPAAESNYHLTAVVRPLSEEHFPPSPPHSPQRQVANLTLKSYADGLFSFTQSRLQTAAPQNMTALSLSKDLHQEETPPPTPELEGEEDEEEVTEMSPRPFLLRSQFSDWSSTTMDSDTEVGYVSRPSSEPQTPDEEYGLISPDSFFASEITPRVAQRNQWAALSSARPSSHIEMSPLDHVTTTSSTEAFSYFEGFDSVTNAVDTRFSHMVSPLATMQSSFVPSQEQQQSYFPHDCSTQERPSTSTTDNKQPIRHDSLTPLEEPVSLSRPPTWLVKAIN
ncbi:hypothetical protein EJ08DRAFT_662336 [Tothia fuscella]|uniref:Uncharacterized protein n=1 Tax=Tothia fuscella TaxID=1048955 RepID=A0A9P4NMX7_9PEZI|nr:hypothetical protein EJ08DRAFT_662336 [Tothia fuscella]